MKPYTTAALGTSTIWVPCVPHRARGAVRCFLCFGEPHQRQYHVCMLRIACGANHSAIYRPVVGRLSIVHITQTRCSSLETLDEHRSYPSKHVAPVSKRWGARDAKERKEGEHIIISWLSTLVWQPTEHRSWGLLALRHGSCVHQVCM